jgi:hypothetical protein
VQTLFILALHSYLCTPMPHAFIHMTVSCLLVKVLFSQNNNRPVCFDLNLTELRASEGQSPVLGLCIYGTTSRNIVSMYLSRQCEFLKALSLGLLGRTGPRHADAPGRLIIWCPFKVTCFSYICTPPYLQFILVMF